MRQDKRVMLTRLIENGETPNLRVMAELIAKKMIEGEENDRRTEI